MCSASSASKPGLDYPSQGLTAASILQLEGSPLCIDNLPFIISGGYFEIGGFKNK